MHIMNNYNALYRNHVTVHTAGMNEETRDEE